MIDQLPLLLFRKVVDHLLSISAPDSHTNVAVTLSRLRLVSSGVRDAVDEYRDLLRKRLYSWCIDHGASLSLPIHAEIGSAESVSVFIFALTCHALHPRSPARVFPDELPLHSFCDCGALDSCFMMVVDPIQGKPEFYCKVYVSGSIFRLETNPNTPITLVVRCPREWWDGRDYRSLLKRY